MCSVVGGLSTVTRTAVKISVIIVAFYGDQWLRPCLEFSRAETDDSLQILIGDNYGNSNVSSLCDNTRIKAYKLPGPLRFAEANNLLLLKTCFSSDYVCFLNQDTKSPPSWIRNASDFMNHHPKIGAITPLISNYTCDSWDPDFRSNFADMPNFGSVESCNLPIFIEVPRITAAAMVVRTSLLLEVGGFDPIFGSYYEDYDLCRRIRAAGYKVGIWSGAMVPHFSGSATLTDAQDRQRQRLIVRNKIIHRLRESKRMRFFQLISEIFSDLPRQLVRALLKRPAAKDVFILLGGYWDALQIGRRLILSDYDQKLAKNYFEQIGWPCTK